ncbi:MAG TPA: ribosome biogenesis GTP-binding protein YihA/YsxC [Nitrospira sp.]|nr:ribosome biogenesis GTP-binding protein YihA/YsxC [Nitrospira sp.]
MKILRAEFIRSCVASEQFPQADGIQIAFVGRSNVGKSSLINSLLQRRGLAKVSKTPGKTRAVNLFSVTTDDAGLPRFLLADLPGYGYARVSKAVRAQWAPLIEDYLTGPIRPGAVVLLVESRHPARDQETIEWLRSIGRPPLVVATKVDKLKPSERMRTLRSLQAGLGISDADSFIGYSSVTGEGRDQLWAALKQRLTRI